MSPNVFSVVGPPREAKGHPIPFIEVHENVFLEPPDPVAFTADTHAHLTPIRERGQKFPWGRHAMRS